MKRTLIHMINLRVQKLSGRPMSAMLALWITSGACTGLAQQSVQPTFPSPAEASQSLFQAVQSNDEETIASILGGPTDLTTSRDPHEDKADRELFVQKYQQMHRLGREVNGSYTLYIGAENWPFPIPLVEKNGVWRFDSDTGQKEILFRQIGENELTAVATAHDFIAAEKRSQTQPDLPDNSPARLLAQAARGPGARDPILFHGYYFRLLPVGSKGKTPGLMALLAYPAEYRSSGVMTFIVTNKDVVYEKDLGPNTPALASTMDAFHKDATWTVTEE